MSKGRAKQKQTKRVVREVIAREQRRQRALWTSIVAALLLVIAGMVGYGVYAGQRPAGKYVPPPGITDTLGVPVGSGPVTVDIYADFMCPACRTFEEAVGDTLDQLVSENKVTVVYHPVAFLDRYSSTQYSTRSSAASGCAAEVGRYRDYLTALFNQQPSQGGPGLSDEELASIGTGLGFGDTFSECVTSGKYRPWTARVTEEATKRGVLATPSVFVNGQAVDPDPQAITAAVDAAQ
ncbi:MAG: disulfide bond formation protein DsbA [Actinobacteria bacterium]|jgi:protein-disulfide isomerase|nr:MAG: disulfide bond formation protein DsbA [Actinomycetota bacterium]